MAGGQLSPSMARRDATRELIGQWMSGLWDEHAAMPTEEAYVAA
jgi:simple sugar transport system ATP-binding protein